MENRLTFLYINSLVIMSCLQRVQIVHKVVLCNKETLSSERNLQLREKNHLGLDLVNMEADLAHCIVQNIE